MMIDLDPFAVLDIAAQDPWLVAMAKEGPIKGTKGDHRETKSSALDVGGKVYVGNFSP